MLVNGRLVGKVPLAQPVRVNAGSVDVELRAPGYKPTLRTVAVAGLQYQPVVIRLEREAGPSPEGRLAMPEGIGAKGDAGEAPSGNWRPWAIGGAIGGAAVGVGAGILGLARHNADINEFNRKGCFETGGMFVREPPNSDLGPCKTLNASAKNATTLSIVGFSAGAALGATALILFLTAPDNPGETRTAHATCVPDLARPGLACALRF